MFRALFLSLSCALLLSSCGTYTGAGAYAGAGIGSVLGSAIGGISGGPRGSDVGTIVGMASGALVGAAVGSAADKAEQEKYEAYQKEMNARYMGSSRNDGSGFDETNSGDDRIEFEGDSESGSSVVEVAGGTSPIIYCPADMSSDELDGLMPGYKYNYNPQIEISNVVFADEDGDGSIGSGEKCKLSFDIINRSSSTIYSINPTVLEVSGNSRIYISQTISIESIESGKGLKYIATISGDEKLKDGSAILRLAVVQGSSDVTSSVYELQIATLRK